MTQETPSSYLRVSQIAPALIPVSQATIWRWVRQGRFPAAIKLSTKCSVWKTSDVHSWLASRKEGS